jgi:hypothetical protein
VTWLSLVGRVFWRAFFAVVALFMLVVILGAGYWTWTTVEDRRLERKISVARDWPSTDILVPVGKDGKERARALKASVKTRCSLGFLYYIFTIEKNDEAKVNEDFEELANRISQFDVELLDSDNFKISSITISLHETRRLLGTSGRVEGREANASVLCERLAYTRATHLTVGWKER